MVSTLGAWAFSRLSSLPSSTRVPSTRSVTRDFPISLAYVTSLALSLARFDMLEATKNALAGKLKHHNTSKTQQKRNRQSGSGQH